MKMNLAICLVITQVALWASYLWFFKQDNIDFQSLWGDTPKRLRSPLLYIATLAYVMNLVLMVSMIRSPNLTDVDEWTLISCVLLYYTAQILFLPLTKLAVDGRIPKCVVTALLLVCVIPFAVICGVVTRRIVKFDTDAVYLKLTTALVPLLHVLINDAIIFGFLF